MVVHDWGLNGARCHHDSRRDPRSYARKRTNMEYQVGRIWAAHLWGRAAGRVHRPHPQSNQKKGLSRAPADHPSVHSLSKPRHLTLSLEFPRNLSPARVNLPPKGGASLKLTTYLSVPPPRSGLPFIPMQSKGLSGRVSNIPFNPDSAVEPYYGGG
jgi:hypothetical protein